MRCRFGGIEALRVTFVANNSLVCTAPAMATPGWVSVEVSNNAGVDYTESGLQFLYVEPASLAYVYPKLGPEIGGTLLMISGSNFHSSASLSCHFWDIDSNRSLSCLLYTSPSPRDLSTPRMPSSA